MDLKDRIKIDELIYAKNSYTLDELNKKINDTYGVTKFDLECEYHNNE